MLVYERYWFMDHDTGGHDGWGPSPRKFRVNLVNTAEVCKQPANQGGPTVGGVPVVVMVSGKSAVVNFACR